ncbi:MAG: hypothetical protein AB1665_06440, partial [Candidatus Thermoplasmatota archaeon]
TSYFVQSHPGNSNSDNDYLNDKQEQEYGSTLTPSVTYGTDPWIADTDADMLSDGSVDEPNALDPDTDGDGLRDDYEHTTTYTAGDSAKTKTSKTNPDTDGDGLYDGWDDDDKDLHWDAKEWKGDVGDPNASPAFSGGYRSHPLRLDSDNDYFNDGEEAAYWDSLGEGKWAENFDGGTEISNLLDADADGDGLGDGTEVKVYGTLPDNKHSDTDTLDDGDEIMIYGTSPLNPDTDYDGLDDGTEVTALYKRTFYGSTTWLYYPPGTPLYITNGVTTKSIGTPPTPVIPFVVDLTNLGFAGCDFYAGYDWDIRDGAGNIYATVSSLNVGDALFWGAESVTVWVYLYVGIFEISFLLLNIEIEAGTNPLIDDTDGDNLLDGEEVTTWKTNPIDEDTDDDGVDDDDDSDPLVDIWLRIWIKEILVIDDTDNYPYGDADLYIKVKVHDTWYSSLEPAGKDTNILRDPDLFDVNVPDEKASSEIPIELKVMDDDSEYGDDIDQNDDICDIDGESLVGYSLKLWYLLEDGIWVGDDYLGDSNGYGHENGADDGRNDENDCDIWFDIWQSDFDNDGLTYWREIDTYGSDPTVPNLDSDGDLIPDWWEDKYGLNLKSNTDGPDDSDKDGLRNWEEFWCGRQIPVAINDQNFITRDMYTFGGSPEYMDLFVEVDWMPSHDLPIEAIWKLKKAFSSGHIALHIDNGWMGGGTVTNEDPWWIWFSGTGDPNTLDTVEEFKDVYFTPSRDGIFHWCLMAIYEHDGPTVIGRSEAGGSTFVVYHGTLQLLGKADSQHVASAFMHELGHNILGKLDASHQSDDSYHCKNDCAMQDAPGNRVYYCSECWNELFRDGLDGVD